MERKLCHECQAENRCKYEGYIKQTAERINSLSTQRERQDVIAAITYLKLKAVTKSYPCPRYRTGSNKNSG